MKMIVMKWKECLQLFESKGNAVKYDEKSWDYRQGQICMYIVLHSVNDWPAYSYLLKIASVSITEISNTSKGQWGLSTFFLIKNSWYFSLWICLIENVLCYHSSTCTNHKISNPYSTNFIGLTGFFYKRGISS